MFSLFQKEITSFFGSITGYLVAFVFLIANSLFLWVFPGDYNLIESGYASLAPYFGLAPWIFLFLIPALTMRLFAEERRSGTMEILLTRPYSLWQLVWGKYLAAIFLVILCLLPTLVYFYAVYSLGNPVGNWDGGAAWGSFIGLFLLAALYVALGIFASSLTDNPIFAFITALFLCFFFYSGFDFVAAMDLSTGVKAFFLSLGIGEHYHSVSRGVVDSRDVLYFVLVTGFILRLTSLLLRRKQRQLKRQIKKLAYLMVGIVLVFSVGSKWFFRIDLTTEKRYSLSVVSKDILEGLDAPVTIDLFLTGDLPAGFRQLQQAIEEKVQDMDAWAGASIRLTKNDPYDITNTEERNKLFSQLVDLGLQPTDIRQNKEEGTVTKLIFPGAVMRYGDQMIGINLLKNNPSLVAEENLNNSIETLEFELINAIRQLRQESKETVAFLTGQGELGDEETWDIRQGLSESYEVRNYSALDLFRTDSMPRAVIVADPSLPFGEQEKFYLDQYVMRGGNVLWLFDPVQVSLDSLSRGETTLAFPRDLNLMDQLFKYGVRVNPDLVQDVECVLIPVNTSPVSSQPKFTPAPWYFSPLLTPASDHVISRNLNRLKSEFVSSVDTVGKNPEIRKTVILHTSPYARKVGTPEEISLESINNPPARELFHVSDIPVGVLLEGQFQSVFANRITNEFNPLGIGVESKSKPAKMIVLADGSLVANKVSRRSGQLRTQPLGYDEYSRQTFGNKAFLLNAVNYLCDNSGIMELRSRVFKIRLLDKVRLREEKTYWQILNVGLPLLFVLLFGLVFNFIRIRKYRG